MTGQTASLSIWSGGGYELAEGTRWLGDRLVFTDILSGTLLAAPGAGPGDARVLARAALPPGRIGRGDHSSARVAANQRLPGRARR